MRPSSYPPTLGVLTNLPISPRIASIPPCPSTLGVLIPIPPISRFKGLLTLCSDLVTVPVLYGAAEQISIIQVSGRPEHGACLPSQAKTQGKRVQHALKGHPTAPEVFPTAQDRENRAPGL